MSSWKLMWLAGWEPHEARQSGREQAWPSLVEHAEPARIAAVHRFERRPPGAEADQAAAAFVRTGTFLAVSTFASVISRMPLLRVAFTPSGSILAGRSNTRKI